MLASRGTIDYSLTSEVLCDKPGDIPGLILIRDSMDLEEMVNLLPTLSEFPDMVLNPFRKISPVWIKVGSLDYIASVDECYIIHAIADLNSIHIDQDSGEELVLTWTRDFNK